MHGFGTVSQRSKAFPFGFVAKKDRGKGFSVLAVPEMEQEPKKERGGEGKGKEGSLSSSSRHRSLTRVIFRVVFDSRSLFFAPEPHLNACYAGYGTVCQELLAYSSFTKIRTQLFPSFVNNNVNTSPTSFRSVSHASRKYHVLVHKLRIP